MGQPYPALSKSYVQDMVSRCSTIHSWKSQLFQWSESTYIPEMVALSNCPVHNQRDVESCYLSYANETTAQKRIITLISSDEFLLKIEDIIFHYGT